MDPVDLDQLLHRQLRALPQPRAPRTLLPSVLAATLDRAVAVRAATGWLTWSHGWQIGSIAALVALIAGASMLVSAPPSGVTNATRTANDAATVVRVFWQVVFQPIAVYIGVLGVGLTLACAAAWAAFEVALGGASHR
ncbi:MAG: hypothetical protein ABIP65_04995 [Vicinamibacterales bacterium]